MSNKYIKSGTILRKYYQKKYNSTITSGHDARKFKCIKCGETCPFQIYWCDKKQCDTIKIDIMF